MVGQKNGRIIHCILIGASVNTALGLAYRFLDRAEVIRGKLIVTE